MADLGTTNSLPYGEADFINDRSQIVGNSFNCDLSTVDAFLWENGSIVDLNTLISPESGIHLSVASYIDNRGEIAALGVVPNGDGRAFLLTPCDDDHPDVEGCDYSMVDASVVQSNNPATRPSAVTPQATSSPAQTVNQLRNRFMQRYRLPGLRPAPSN